jgi:hypothetical protein
MCAKVLDFQALGEAGDWLAVKKASVRSGQSRGFCLEFG